MGYESLMIQAMTYAHPAELPVSIGFLPAVWKRRAGEVREIVRAHRALFPDAERMLDERFAYDTLMPDSYRAGTFTDEWGCVWRNVEEGMEAIVVEHPLPRREQVRGLAMPTVRDGRMPHGFLYLRLLDLRGFEEVMIDFAEECEELQMLIDTVTAYDGYQMEVLLRAHKGAIVWLGDDLGMQHGLAMGAERWRKYLKPAFAKLYAQVRRAGKYVFMHTDGCIYEIMPDLMEAGAHIINPQYRANGLDNLVRVCRGKIPILLDLDRQLFPHATPSQLRDHVRACVEALYLPSGGLGLSIELGPDVPVENMEALVDEADKLRFFKG